MSEYSLAQKLAAELIGTALLVAAVIGSGIMAIHLTSDVGLQLLGNTIPTGAILYVLITIFGPVSGAHFNPVVSLVLSLNRLFPFSHVFIYALMQIMGGLLGVAIAHIMFEMPIIEVSTQIRTGNALWFSEFIATFGLVMIILLGGRHSESALPALVAFYITSAYWFTASTSFANPAVTIARSLTNSFTGIAPSSCIGFIIAQVFAALTALLVTRSLFNTKA